MTKTENKVINHRKEWENSAVSNNIYDLNVISYEPLSFESNYNYELEQADVYGQLLYGAPRSWYNNNGILKADKLRDYKHLEKGGWWCSGVNILTGENSEWGCFKPDEPRTNYDGKSIKYEVPPKVSTEIFALKISEKNWENIANTIGVEKTGDDFWQWVLNDATIPLFITEGAKKAGSLLTAGYPTIALPGINNILTDNRLNPFIEAFVKAGREIYICFDQDVKYKTRQNTYKAIHKLGEILENLGCKVKVIVWNPDLGKGVDDVIFQHGKEEFKKAFDNSLTLEDYIEKGREKLKKLDEKQLLQFLKGELGKELKFNELKGRIEYQDQPMELTGDLRFWLVDEFGYSVSKSNILDGLSYVARKNAYHPVKRYLNQVAQDVEPVNIDNLATRYFGTDNPLYDLFIKKWLIGAVARIFRPGCKVDNALILHGAQGINKSTFFSILGGDWFDASVEDFNSKDSKLVLHKCWIQELAEFERISNRNSQDKIKQFMALTHDSFRKPYAYEACDYARQFIFCGSVNKSQFLMDETGNRRFWVIPVPAGHVIPTELLQEERDAIWSAAVKAYRAGEKWWLARDIEKSNADNNSSFEFVDEWEGEIEKYISDWDKVYVSEILSTVFKIDIALQDRITQMRVSNILTKLGWKKSGRERIAGKQVMMWQKIKSEEKVCTGMHTTTESITQSGLQAVHTPKEEKEGGMHSISETIDKTTVQPVHTSNTENGWGMHSINNHMSKHPEEVCTEVCTAHDQDGVKASEKVCIPSTPVSENSKLSKNTKTKNKTGDMWVRISKDIVPSGILINCALLPSGYVVGHEAGVNRVTKVRASDCEFYYE